MSPVLKRSIERINQNSSPRLKTTET